MVVVDGFGDDRGRLNSSATVVVVVVAWGFDRDV